MAIANGPFISRIIALDLSSCGLLSDDGNTFAFHYLIQLAERLILKQIASR